MGLPPRPGVEEPLRPSELRDVLLDESLGWSPINCFCFVASSDTIRPSACTRKCSAKPQNALDAHDQSHCWSTTHHTKLQAHKWFQRHLIWYFHISEPTGHHMLVFGYCLTGTYTVMLHYTNLHFTYLLTRLYVRLLARKQLGCFQRTIY